jgi:hypothetical protein
MWRKGNTVNQDPPWVSCEPADSGSWGHFHLEQTWHGSVQVLTGHGGICGLLVKELDRVTGGWLVRISTGWSNLEGGVVVQNSPTSSSKDDLDGGRSCAELSYVPLLRGPLSNAPETCSLPQWAEPAHCPWVKAEKELPPKRDNKGKLNLT